MLRVFLSLLYLYPSAYRREFGDEMSSVFLAARSGVPPMFARAIFYLREMKGLLAGALHAHLFSVFGHDDWMYLRRFKMRPQFRFPRSTVFMMWVILAGVLLAIEKAKTVQVKYGPQEVMAVWNSLPWFLLFFPALACATVAVVWGILFALHRTGMHRLNNVGTRD